MAAGRLLVIAPDNFFRRSLEFALETEGFAVRSMPVMPSSDEMAGDGFDCTIIDEQALQGNPAEISEFCDSAYPVLLLSYRPVTWLTGIVAQVLDKPLRGNEVIEAVRELIVSKPRGATT